MKLNDSETTCINLFASLEDFRTFDNSIPVKGLLNENKYSHESFSIKQPSFIFPV